MVEPNYKIKSIDLAELGRKEIELAEVEMPGLMNCREEYGKSKPLTGARVSGSLHMTIQTAVLIETLENLGAEVRWCSCNIYSTQDQAAAAIAKNGTAVFAWKGENLADYWWCTMRALEFPDGKGPTTIVDDGGDMTLLIHEGIKWEEKYEENKSLPDPESADGEDELELILLLRKSIPEDPTRFRRLSKDLVGISEETTTGIHRLENWVKNRILKFPVINVNDAVTKSKFDNVYGCRHSVLDGIYRATDVLVAGKKVVICGFGEVGKGCAQAFKGVGARVYITEIDPICALQACMEGFEVKRLESIIEQVDIIVSATGCKKIVTVDHMKRMKNNSIVSNIGHFDNEIDMAGLKNYPGIKKETIKENVLHRWVFPETGRGVLVLAEGRLMNLGCATGHPSFVMSNSFTNQIMAQVELWTQRGKGKYENGKLYLLPKELDEKVASLHLKAFDAELTILTEDQSNYIHIPQQGPFKGETYKY